MCIEVCLMGGILATALYSCIKPLETLDHGTQTSSVTDDDDPDTNPKMSPDVIIDILEPDHSDGWEDAAFDND